MIVWLAAAGLAALSASCMLAANARAYTRRVEAQFPPSGRFVVHGDTHLHVREVGPAPESSAASDNRDGSHSTAESSAARILLIHGASANLLELWGPLADEFAPRHAIIAFDRPGLGFSTRVKRKGYMLAYQAQCAARVLEATGDTPAIIVGHSLGAAVALRLALDHPQHVRGLVLIAPACNPYPGKPAWWARLASTPLLGDIFCGLITPWLGPMLSSASIANNFWPAPVPVGYPENAGVPLIFRPRAFRANALDVCATNAEFAAQAPRYADLLTPTLIVTAEKDRIVSPKRHARALASMLPAGELVIAPDTGHMPHRLRTDLVAAAIRRVNEMTSTATER